MAIGNVMNEIKQAGITDNARHLVKTVVKTLGDVTDTSADFQFASAANTTEQPIDLGAIIPAYAHVVGAVIVCTEAVAGGMTLAIDVGFTTGAADLIVSADCDDLADITETAAGAACVGTVSSTAKNVWVNGTPTSANWSAMTAGKWTIMVSYIDYNEVIGG